MLLLMTVFLYGVCVYLIRGVTLTFFGGRKPSGKKVATITALAIFWPLWSEMAPVLVVGLAL